MLGMWAPGEAGIFIRGFLELSVGRKCNPMREENKLKCISSVSFPQFRTKGLSQSLMIHASEEWEQDRQARPSILHFSE